MVCVTAKMSSHCIWPALEFTWNIGIALQFDFHVHLSENILVCLKMPLSDSVFSATTTTKNDIWKLSILYRNVLETPANIFCPVRAWGLHGLYNEVVLLWSDGDILRRKSFAEITFVQTLHSRHFSTEGWVSFRMMTSNSTSEIVGVQSNKPSLQFHCSQFVASSMWTCIILRRLRPDEIKLESGAPTSDLFFNWKRGICVCLQHNALGSKNIVILIKAFDQALPKMSDLGSKSPIHHYFYTPSTWHLLYNHFWLSGCCLRSEQCETCCIIPNTLPELVN